MHEWWACVYSNKLWDIINDQIIIENDRCTIILNLSDTISTYNYDLSNYYGIFYLIIILFF